MKINCVIVNYNDADMVIRLLNRIHDYKSLDGIVVVDNRSQDDSWQRLKSLEDRKTVVIQGGKNGGYGYGNNLGVKYAVRTNQATHVIIANPDVEFTERAILSMCRVFKKHLDVGIVAPVMEDMQYGGMGRGWRLHGFAGELLCMGPVSRRLFRGFLNYPESYYRGKKAVYVDVVHGSMLMVDAAVFLKCGGYDERIFLYQEESVLAWRMKNSGYRTVLLLAETYIHRHGTSIAKSCESQWRRQKLRHKSLMHYMRHYLGISRGQMWVAKVWFGGILAEIWMAAGAEKVFRAINKRRKG